MQDIVNLFIKNALAGKDVTKINLFNSIVALFEGKLKELNIPKLNRQPRKPENPFLFFHLSAMKHNPDAYPFLCLAFHLALVHVENVLAKSVAAGTLPKKKAAQRLESIVIPFIHSARFYEIDAHDQLFTESPSFNKIKEALWRGQANSSVRYHKDLVVKAYIRDVTAALSSTYSPKASRNIAHTPWGRQIFYGRKYLEETVTANLDGAQTPPIPLVASITFNEKTEEEAAEGAYPIEEAEEIFEGTDSDLARVLLLRQISPAGFQGHWAKQSIPLNTYSFFCHAAAKRAAEKMTDKELAFLTFLVILIFYGFAPKKTSNIVIKKIPTSEEELKYDTIYCDPNGTSFFYRISEDQVASIFARKEDRTGIYRDSGNIVIITSGIISTILTSFLRRTQLYRGTRPFLFIYRGLEGKTQRFTLELFESIGKSLEGQYGTFPSAYAFPRSFFNYATTRYGVDPIVSAYVSDRVTRELRAPVFYSNVSSERLNNDLFNMQTQFLTDIAQNARKCSIPFNKHIWFPEVGRTEIETVSFGSKLVPVMESMRNTVNTIKNYLLTGPVRGLIPRYNIFMFYLILLWELTCGFRQIEIERLEDNSVDGESGLVVVCGKGNRLYTESRLISINPFATRIFEEARSCRTVFRQSLINAGKCSPSEISGQPAAGFTFSLATSNGQLIPASSINVRRLLLAAAIEFPYKLNSPRHLLRTFLFDKKVNYKYLAAFFGHQTKGKEFLSFYSLDRLEDMKDAISSHIDVLIDELALEIICHRLMVTNGKD
ncbi:MAG: hypothetical protein M0Z61_16990 [Nitrospiraceae bacterium]|nr:hypothetical protein [Nitrospiraceae bacterium]